MRETWRVYWSNLRVFATIGGITIPATLTVSALQYLLATNADFAALTGLSEDSPELLGVLSAVSFLTRGVLLILVAPAVIQAVEDIVAGRTPEVRRSFREGFARIPDLVWTLARGALIVLLLTVTVIGIPWAINRSMRWMFASQAAVLGGIRGKTALDDSATAVRGRWWQAAAQGAVLGFVGAMPGVVVALAMLMLVHFPVDAANSVSSLVFALTQPFAIAGLTLLYLRWRGHGAEVSRSQDIDSRRLDVESWKKRPKLGEAPTS